MVTFFIFYKDLKYATFLSNVITQTNNNINLIDCIVYAHEHPKYNVNQIILNKFYKLVAKKYNTNVNSIKWNVHTAISDMYKSTNVEFRKKVYGTDFGVTPQKIIQIFSDIC